MKREIKTNPDKGEVESQKPADILVLTRRNGKRLAHCPTIKPALAP